MSLQHFRVPPLCSKPSSWVSIILPTDVMALQLCNGCRLQMKTLHKNAIEATIVTGFGAGETVFMPKIPLVPSYYPFQFKHIQPQVKVCNAMTIKKAQLLSLRIGLKEGLFSHGPRYIACSRVSPPEKSMVISQQENRTKNVI